MELRRAIDGVSPRQRDGWVDALLGLDDIPPDTSELPHGCVPYLPCPVDTILAMLDRAEVRAEDTFVDLGSGAGRVILLANMLTGASAIGIEIQSHLVTRARALAEAHRASRVTSIHGDAAELAGTMAAGTVFFLYCPFSGGRLDRVLEQLEQLGATRSLRVCTVDLPPISRSWLELVSPTSGGLAIYRSVG